MAEVTLTKDNFDTEVLQADGPVLVDFYADWCGPCKMQGPIVEELAQEMAGSNTKVAKLNVDEAQEIAGKYEVMSIPTLIIFNKGQVADKLIGVHTKDDLKARLEKVAA